MTHDRRDAPARWGDPAAAAALPDAARGLVELAFGRPTSTPPRRSAEVRLPAAGAAPTRCSTALRGLRRRRARAHRRRDPAAAHPRQVDARPAAAARRRPGRRPRRRRPPGRPRRGRRPCSRWCASSTGSRVVPFGGGTSVVGGLAAPPRRATPAWSPRPGAGSKRLVAVDAESMTATLEPGLRGPEAEALLAEHGLTLGPLPAVVRVRLDRRLRRHPLQRPGVAPATAASTPWSSASRVATPRGTLELGQRARQRRRPRPAPAGPRLRGRVRRDHPVTVRVRPVPGGEGLRGLALAVVRRRRRRDAHAGPGRAAARPCCGSPTRPRPRSTSPSPTRSAGASGAAAA